MTETPGFQRFWSAWPRNELGGYSRKGSKQECIKLWLRGHHETQTDTICKHVAWLKTTPDWLKDCGMYIPAPAVYLRQQRWDGAEIPEPRQWESEVLEQMAKDKAASQTPESIKAREKAVSWLKAVPK